MNNQNFSLFKRIQSFRYAFNGIYLLLKEEHNARIHVFASIIVLIAGYFLNLSEFEWIAILFAIGFVISMEIVNSSIENIADFISPERNESIKKIKDLGAAAVLISAIIAATIGLIIFIPKIVLLIN